MEIAKIEKYSLACKALQTALAEIKTPSAIKEIAKDAANIKEFARRAGNKELEGDGWELRKQAERHLGLLLQNGKEHRAKVGKPKANGSDADPLPTLKALQIDKHLADRARRSAEMTLKDFNEMIREGRADIFRRAEKSQIAKANRAQRHQSIAKKATQNLKLDYPGPFPLIYADPPWKWGHFGEQDEENEKGKDRTPDAHYPTLTYDQIRDFKIQGHTIDEIASPNAALALWCTSSNLKLALGIMYDWGFDYKTHSIWVKDRQGLGFIFRNKHELLLWGTRGSFPAPQYLPASAQSFPRGKHSEKPAAFRKLIERMYPDFEAKHRLELFAREKLSGWTCYGNEA